MYQVVEREATFTTGTRTLAQQQENIQLAGNLSYRSGAEDKATMRNGAAAGGKWKVVEDDNFAVSTGNFSQNQFYPTAATNNMIGQTTLRRDDAAF